MQIKAREEIFALMDQGKTIVMPTEVSARVLSTEYAIDRKSAIRADQALSFDTFTSNLYKASYRGVRRVDSIDQLLFATYLGDSRAEEFTHFYDESYPELKDNLSSYLLTVLPSLSRVTENVERIKDESVRQDLMLIKREYLAYLATVHLADESFLYPKELDSSVLFLFPEAFPKEKELFRRLANRNEAIRLDAVHDLETGLNVYKNEKEELRATFLEIRRLINEGVSLDKIALSSAALTRLTPFIKAEAKLFDVPLSFVAGIKIKDTVPGKFLSLISELYENSFRLEDMRRLFLSPAFNFVNRDGIKVFIERAVSNNIRSATGSDEKDRYMKLSSSREGEGFNYIKFKKAVKTVMEQRELGLVISSLQFLMNMLFGSERFSDNAEDQEIYAFISHELTEFISRLSQLPPQYELKNRSPFSLFISFVLKETFVSENRVKGVSVYPFTMAAATVFDYHFILTLNESEAKASVKEGSFLTANEREGLSEDDLTLAILDSYRVMTKELYLSSSLETYVGNKLPLVALLDRVKNSSLDKNDSYQAESSNSRAGEIYPVQKNSYDRFLSIASRNAISDEVSCISGDRLSLSFTQIKSYQECPFKYALRYRFGLGNLPSYTSEDFDSIEVGNRLHSVFERYFRARSKGEELTLSSVFDSEMEAWRSNRSFCFESGEERLKELPSYSYVPNDSLIRFIKKQHFANMERIAKELEERVELSSIRCEEREPYRDVTFPGLQLHLNGKIDLSARLKDSDSYCLIDYKTGSTSDPNQFNLYSLLFSSTGRKVSYCAFAFTKTGKIDVKWKAEENGGEDKIEALLTGYEEIYRAILAGNFKKTENLKNCSGCEFKAICRRRMNVV